MQLTSKPGLFIAGQLTGVEGYVESAAMGIFVGLQVAAKLKGQEFPAPPRTTAYGSLLSHLADDTPREFAPMNINWGLFPEPSGDFAKKQAKELKKAARIAAALEGLQTWKEECRANDLD
jgi:methylenetetrahydrofolate--tRNA-(uracil-5-)-methyltransferase